MESITDPIPFVYSFKTSTPPGNFIYDIGTNLILKVEDVVWDILGLLGTCGRTEIIQRLQLVYSTEQITLALQEIETCRTQHGVFQDRQINMLRFPLSDEEIVDCQSSKVGHVILNVTEDCNLRCAYCKFGGAYTYERVHRPVHMPETIGKNAIDFLEKHSSAYQEPKLSVGFYGGEPFLRFRFITDIVNYAREKLGDKVRFSITTNGTLLTDKVITFIIKEDFVLNVSLDGPKILHDRYRQTKDGRGTLDSILHNLQKIKMGDPDYFKRRVGASIVFAPPFDLISVMRFFTENENCPAGALLLNVVDPEDTAFYDQFDSQSIWKDYMDQMNNLRALFVDQVMAFPDKPVNRFLWDLFGRTVISDIHHRLLSPLPPEVYPNGICLPGCQRLFIGTDGAFYPCEKIGPISIGDIYNGFDPSKIKKLISQYIEISQDCLSCWAVRLCKCCFIRAKRNDKLDEDRKREHCKSLRERLDNSLKMYCSIMQKNPTALDKLSPIKPVEISEPC